MNCLTLTARAGGLRGESLEFLGEIGMPSRERRPILGHVARRPENTPPFHLGRHFIIRTDNIEIASL